MTEIRRFPDSAALAHGAAQLFVACARSAIEQAGRFNVVLAGGSTPKAMYQLLAGEYSSQVVWEKVHCFWGDERSVPSDHADSNYRMVDEALLQHVPMILANIHRIPTELPAEQAASHYESTLRHRFPSVDYPQFDLIFLGMGEDGHTASLFPHTKALASTNWVDANHVPQLDTWRITLTAPLINHAANVAFLVSGGGKASVLQEVINGPYLPDTYPSQMIEPIHGNLLWYVDEAAAELIGQ